MKPPVEEHVSQIRLLEEGKHGIYERYYCLASRLLQPAETLHHFPHPNTPVELALYAQEEGRGEWLRAHGSPRSSRTHPLSYVGLFPSSQIRLPPSVRDRAETLRAPHLQLPPIHARKRSKHQLTIPLNPIHSRMMGMDPDVFLTPVVFGADAGVPGVKDVLDVGCEGAWVLVWRTEGSGAREWSGLRALVIAGPTDLREKVSKHFHQTPFFPRMPNIYFENLHPTPGAPAEKNEAELLPIATSFFRQIIEQLRPHLNTNTGEVPMIERGTPMGFEAIAYARSTILKDFIGGVGAAFQSIPATNAHASANPPTHECPMFVTGPTDCRSSQNYKSPGYLQRLMDGPTIDSFGLTPVDGEHDTPVQSRYAAPQPRNHSTTLARTTLLDMCSPTGSTERQVVPTSHRKQEFRDARKSGWGDLRALGEKSRTRRNIKIGDGSKRLKSKLIAIKNPHSDGVRVIFKDKATAEAKEAKKVASL
ncbi:hypothetical protein HOY80DRAFT_1110819 [Tuber brumale]|nr:hypothetical protein HOY80DRAFT_1110819 [Tuber brumale]